VFKLELVMSCLFFDDPKNNKGFIHYKPLKMCKTAVRFLRIFEEALKKGLPQILLRKPKWWLSALASGLNSQFWLWNVVFLPRASARVNGMESWNWGLCPRLM